MLDFYDLPFNDVLKMGLKNSWYAKRDYVQFNENFLATSVDE